MELANITYRGHVDLQNCEDEPIHVPGSIQPHGYLIAVDKHNVVKFCSENCTELGWVIKDVLELPLATTLDDQQWQIIQKSILDKQDYTQGNANTLTVNNRRFNLLTHATQQLTILEFEPTEEVFTQTFSLNSQTFRFSRELAQAESLTDLCQKVARNIQEIIGYDRVMIYKFDEEFNGHVLAEALVGTHIDPYLGLNYPHTDIPPQARELYLKNLVRSISDTHYTPVAVLTRQPDSHHGSLDLSMSVLRSVSPIHIQYLKNMGVRATFTVSIIAEGKLWGMVACHHHLPKNVILQNRTSALLQATLLSSQLKVVDAIDELRGQQKLEKYLGEFQATIANVALAQPTFTTDTVVKMVNADAFLLVSNVLSIEVRTKDFQEDIRILLALLTKKKVDFFVTDNISLDLKYESNSSIAGVLYHCFGGGTQALWIRKEVKKEVVWAGNPHKSVAKKEIGLSPRLSFAAWTEIKKGFSCKWSKNELEIAKRGIFSIQDRLTNLTAQLLQLEENQLMSQLVKTNSELENILWVTSHDLQEPIRKIRMFISLLEEEEAVVSNGILAKSVSRIANSAERMHEMLDDLSLLNRSRRLEISKQFVDLNTILNEVRQVYEDFGFTLNLNTDAPSVKGKAVLLMQLFTNIIDNSIKYADPSRPLIVNIDFEKEVDIVKIIISDNGVGFDMQYAILIFQIFKRVNDDATIKGTGVGLAVCKKIVESMQGEIYAESKKNVGTRFIIELPVD